MGVASRGSAAAAFLSFLLFDFLGSSVTSLDCCPKNATRSAPVMRKDGLRPSILNRVIQKLRHACNKSKPRDGFGVRPARTRAERTTGLASTFLSKIFPKFSWIHRFIRSHPLFAAVSSIHAQKVPKPGSPVSVLGKTFKHEIA